MKNLFALIALSFALSSASAADLKSTFRSLDGLRKGPFSLNFLQGSVNRVVVNQGEPAGEFQFQAAFRNDTARVLSGQYDFYVANLFTTNYYELIGEYVYGDLTSSHPLNHQGLIDQGPAAFSKAASMVRHWVLEKYYVETHRDSVIARAFRLRGISGSEFEQVYAGYFINFYLRFMNEDRQFLPVLLLAKSSPLVDSSALEKARTQIAASYDWFKSQYGQNDDGVRRLYQIRNVIHNQLSQDAVVQLENFMRDYSRMVAQDGRIAQVLELLRSYYSVSAQKVSRLASQAGLADVQQAADAIVSGGLTPANARRLSLSLAQLRSDLAQPEKIAYAQQSEALAVLMVASQYLNKELSNLRSVSSVDFVRASLDLVYAEGFLIRDNWDYFTSEMDSAANAPAASALLADAISIAQDTLTQAFDPAFDQWLQIDPKMQSFVDNVMKSSAVNTASLVVGRTK